MKIDKLRRFWVKTIAVSLCVGYLGAKLSGYSGQIVEMTWGMAVFFACVYWFSEVEE